jgi:hypothetical protein
VPPTSSKTSSRPASRPSPLQKATVDFWDRYLKGDTAALGKLRTDASVPGATTFQENAGTPNG